MAQVIGIVVHSFWLQVDGVHEWDLYWNVSGSLACRIWFMFSVQFLVEASWPFKHITTIAII